MKICGGNLNAYCILKKADQVVSKPGSERQSLHVFSHMWKIDPKDKCIYKKKHIHIYI
jgi:hypothetical protein